MVSLTPAIVILIAALFSVASSEVLQDKYIYRTTGDIVVSCGQNCPNCVASANDSNGTLVLWGTTGAQRLTIVSFIMKDPAGIWSGTGSMSGSNNNYVAGIDVNSKFGKSDLRGPFVQSLFTISGHVSGNFGRLNCGTVAMDVSGTQV